MYTRIMPFRLHNVTAHCQRVMDHEVCKAALQKNSASFVDGTLIYSKTADEHWSTSTKC